MELHAPLCGQTIPQIVTRAALISTRCSHHLNVDARAPHDKGTRRWATRTHKHGAWLGAAACDCKAGNAM
eukprot:719769-Lingulodinium_polyedra.AAC.1